MRKTVVMAILLLCTGTGIACRTPTAGLFGAKFNEAVFRANATIRTFPASVHDTGSAVGATLNGLGVLHDGFYVDGELDPKFGAPRKTKRKATDKDTSASTSVEEAKVSRVTVSGKTPDGKPLTLHLNRKPEGSEIALLVGTAQQGNDTVFCNTFLERVGKLITDLPKTEPKSVALPDEAKAKADAESKSVNPARVAD